MSIFILNMDKAREGQGQKGKDMQLDKITGTLFPRTGT